MNTPLDAPRSSDDLYLARAADTGDVSVLRPIMTGDVFRAIDIPGVECVEGDEERFGMVVSHPCSMREGSTLKSGVQVIRVVKCDPIGLDEWPKRYYDRMPLPDLTVIADPDDVSADDPEAEVQVRTQEGAHAALLDFRGRVPSTRLDLSQRVACLTDEGVSFLHQRMSHFETRYAPEIDKLMDACRAVFAEIELWENWNETLVDRSRIGGSKKLQAELDRVGEIFDRTLSEKRPIPNKKNGWYTLRDDLKLTRKHAGA